MPKPFNPEPGAEPHGADSQLGGARPALLRLRSLSSLFLSSLELSDTTIYEP